MERQLKERLVGAAVLVAAAVILVPEMFSGRAQRAAPDDEPVATSASSAPQLKTYHIDLQSAQPSTTAMADSAAVTSSAAAVESAASSIEPPMAAPRDELPSAEAPTAQPEPVTQAVSSAKAAASASSAPTIMPKPVTMASAPVAAPTATPAAADGDWTIQIGSFGTETRAKEIAAQLKSKGQSAYVTAVKVSGKTFYRVRVGAFTSRAAAESALAKLKGSYSGASVVPAN